MLAVICITAACGQAPHSSVSSPQPTSHPVKTTSTERPSPTVPPAQVSPIGWNEPRLVSGGNFSSISCPTTAFCVAVDNLQTNNIYTYHAGKWSTATSRTGLESVSCVSSTFCVAVGNVYALVYNGSSWSAPVTDSPSFLTSVSCISSTFCAASEYHGNVEVYNGSSWKESYVPGSSGLASISCTSPTFCVAVGGGSVVMFNGSSWSSPVSVDPGTQLSSVSCTSSQFCMAVGGTSAVPFNGKKWMAPEPVGNYGLAAVSCSGKTFCIASGGNGDAFTYNGSGWSDPSQMDSTYNVVSLSCPELYSCAAADDVGRITFSSGW